MADLEETEKEIIIYLDVEDSRYNMKRRDLAYNNADYFSSCMGKCTDELRNKIKLSNKDFDVSITQFVDIFYKEVHRREE